MKNISLKNVELLAPAGSYDSFIAAINAGADAVYMGLKNFNARVMTNNFDIEEYKQAIDYAHKRDVKVYLTLNTLLLDSEIKQALESVYELYTVGLDGVIVQDLGIADLIHKLMPDLSLHASTQMSICTLEQAKVLEELGFERVVLARELSIEEIKHIAQNTKLEIEVFVHGALCVSVSGQCLMSAMIGARSANRGSCAGPCRKKYSLYNGQGKLIQKNKYLLSKKDIFGLDKLKQLVEAGVNSLKIEGRNKTPEYVAGVVKNYKDALINGYDCSQDTQVLQLFNRSGKSDGYLNGVKYRNSISEFSPKNTGILLGKVLDTKKNYVKVELKEDVNLHDGIETIGETVSSTIITCIRNNKFEIVNSLSKRGQIVWLGDIQNVKVGDVIYKTSSNELNQKFESYANINLKRLMWDVCVIIKKDEYICAKANDIEVKIHYLPELSKTSSINEQKIKDAFAKTEETALKFNVSCNIEPGLFVPASKLNELRKELVKKLEETKITRRQIEGVSNKLQELLEEPRNSINNAKSTTDQIQNSLYIYQYNKEINYVEYYTKKYNKKLDVIYVMPGDLKKYEQDILKYKKDCKIYFVIPNVTLKNMTKYIDDNLEKMCKKGISGILLGNIGFIPLCNKLKQQYNVEIIADYSLNIMNKYAARKLKELGICKVTPLFEIDDVDLEGINSILPLELVQDMATVMTTRYCVIASFAKDVCETTNCEAECMKNNYYLIDELNKRYDILPDSFDCITRYIRNKKQYEKGLEDKYSIRHCVLK